MVKNGYKSRGGRSAIARGVLSSATGNTNGMLPQIYVRTSTGELVNAGYFGGMKKGGSRPNATGAMRPPGTPLATQISSNAFHPNLLYKFHTNPNRFNI